MPETFITIFNDKKMFIPASIKQKLKIGNGDLISIAIERIYVSDVAIIEKIKRQLAVSS